MNTYLSHHGIPGQKWGVRNGPPYPLSRQSGRKTFRDIKSELLKNSQKKNIDKFGKDKNHNILYIDGVSGSGKTTLANLLKDDNTEIIHLDAYFERRNIQEARKNRNKNFDQFLKECGFNQQNLESNELFKNDIVEYFNNVDKFVKLSERFGEKSFKNNKKVIMEGIQIGDETLYIDKSFYEDKPFIKLTTDAQISRERARKRDLKH